MTPSQRAGDHTRPTPALDLIFIEGLSGHTVIGIHDGEDRPQPLVIDVQAGVRRALACDTDCIADTIDYSVVRERLLRLLAEHSLKLLEALAEAIADILLDEFGAAWVRVTVTKPNKLPDVKAFGVQIERSAGAGDSRAAKARPVTVLQLLASGMVPGAI